ELHLKKLTLSFVRNSGIYNDDFFLLSSQIYLFLMIIANRYKNNEVLNFFSLDELIEEKTKTDNLNNKTTLNQIINSKKKQVFDESQLTPQKAAENNSEPESTIIESILLNKSITKQSLLVTSKFFSAFTKSCEFSFPVRSREQ